MRKVVEKVTAQLRAFLSQRDNLALVVQSPSAEAAGILQILEVIEEESTSQMFCKFAEAFATAEDYAAVLVESFASRHELIRQLQIREGQRPLPALPGRLADASLAPAQRVRELMVFARSLLPSPTDSQLVWVMFPALIEDTGAYARFIAEVVHHEFPLPWCHHMRLILLDDARNPALHAKLGKAPRLQWWQPDMSPAAFEKAAAEEADDATLPLDERLQALLVTAANDYSHKKYDLAMSKYELIFQHYSAVGNLPLTAVALNGMGEAFREKGKKGEAGACFEAALVPASEGATPPVPVLLNVSTNLANLRMEERRYEDAEAYYDMAQKLATAMRVPEVKLALLDQLGLARNQQKKIPEALEVWKAGALVADALGIAPWFEAHSQRLRKHFSDSRNSSGLRDWERQLEESRASRIKETSEPPADKATKRAS